MKSLAAILLGEAVGYTLVITGAVKPTWFLIITVMVIAFLVMLVGVWREVHLDR